MFAAAPSGLNTYFNDKSPIQALSAISHLGFYDTGGSTQYGKIGQQSDHNAFERNWSSSSSDQTISRKSSGSHFELRPA